MSIPAKLFPRYNIAPTQMAPVVAIGKSGAPSMQVFRWGLVPSWSKTDKEGARMINARCETVATLPSFRTAFKKHRCLVIADGFYEWLAMGKAKQPYRFVMQDPETPLFFAGLWESWRSATDPEHPLLTFSIITTTPNDLVAPVHDRMPVILPQDTWDQWLDPDAKPDHLQALLKPYDATSMKSYKVTPEMGRASFENPAATEPLMELI